MSETPRGSIAMTRELTGLLAVVLAIFGTRVEADWPQFRGPDRNGMSREKGLARHWPVGGPEELWRQKVGVGYGGASIRDGKVFLIDREENEREVLRCFDLAGGNELWRCSNESPGRIGHNGSRSVPTVEADRVYAGGLFGHLICVDRTSHEIVWSHDLMKEYGAESPQWGFSQSPLVYKDLVIVALMNERAGVAAFDKRTGKLIWTTKPAGGESHSSPYICTLAGVEGILFTAREQQSFINPETGDFFWTYNGYECFRTIPAPTYIGDGRLFFTGGYDAGSVMVKVTREGGVFKVVEQFRFDDLGAMIHQPLIYQGHLYANFNENSNLDRKKPPGIICLDLNGREKWRTGKANHFDRGAVMLADGMLFMLDGETGELALAEATSEAYKELARTKVFAGGRQSEIWAPLALSDGKLVLRDQQELVCLDVSSH